MKKPFLAIVFLCILILGTSCLEEPYFFDMNSSLFKYVRYVSYENNETKAQELASYIHSTFGTPVDVVKGQTAEQSIMLSLNTELKPCEVFLSFEGKNMVVEAYDEEALNEGIENLKTIIESRVTNKRFAGKLNLQGVSSAIRVMSFNVQYKAENLHAKTTNIINYFGYYQPDLIGTQEMTSDLFEHLSSNFVNYRHFGESRDSKKKQYNTIYYNYNRLQLLEYGTKWLTGTPDSESKVENSIDNRIVTYGVFKIIGTNQVFLYGNTHLDHYKSNIQEGTDDCSRLEQARYLVSILSDISERYDDCPIIVNGDLNCQDGDSPIEHIKDSGYVDAKFIATYSSASEYTYASKIIDFIFMARTKVCSLYDVCKIKFDNEFISDHHPIIADVVFTSK